MVKRVASLFCTVVAFCVIAVAIHMVIWEIRRIPAWHIVILAVVAFIMVIVMWGVKRDN